jgi:nitrate reductase delta subunit
MGLWSRPEESRHGEVHLLAVERLKDWTRGRFVLTPDETVLVTETPTSLPGYPPIETLVAFWTTDGTRHHFKVFKPVEEIVEDDFPPPWLKASLAYSEGMSCPCC